MPPEAENPDEKWQLIYKRHQDLKRQLKKRGIRPLTIVVTRDIRGCEQAAEELIDFLQEWEKISAEDAARKVLPVTSSSKHQPNIARLRTVDSPASKVEWIVSVSMLSEGWDVKNVFQIVPHEERAFNSKLLIAQVLGRGLRRPEGWTGQDPFVTVFNHDSWSGRIKHLVNEVLEKERRLSSFIIANSSNNFDLHNLDYNRDEDVSEYRKKGEYRVLENGYVELPSQVEAQDVSIEFERAATGARTTFTTKLQHKTYSVEEVAERMFQALKLIDEESKDALDAADRTKYAKRFPRTRCIQVVESSMKRAKIKSGRITEENKQKFLQALGTLRRKSAKRVVYKLRPKALIRFSTSERQAESCSAAELRRKDRTIFFTPDSESVLEDEQLELFREVCDPDGDFTGAAVEIANSYDFKTPLNMVIADKGPERKFVRLLTEPKNAKAVDAWLKSAPQKFYAIEYAWKKGNTPKRGEFNPDFFIKKGDMIFVVETKGDEEISEPSPENQKKYEYAFEHFQRLNKWLKKEGFATRYQLNFVSPKDYNQFFQRLRDNTVNDFRSELDIVMRKTNGL